MMMPGGMMPGGSMMPGMMPGMMPSMQGFPSGNPAGMMGANPGSFFAGSSSGLPPGMLPGMLPSLGPPGMQPPPPQMPPSAEVMAAFKLNLAEQLGGEEEAADPPAEPICPALDPEVKKLCDHFQIEAECGQKLNEEIAKRQDTKESDLAKLYDILDDVGDPSGLLEFKIDEMASGEFVGNILEDRGAMALGLNYGLSNAATQKLYELASNRATRKGEDLVRMELLLECAKDPSATAIRYAEQVLKNNIEGLPDLSEAQDVIKKFELDSEARQKLIEIVLARTEDSSALLGGLEVYFEAARSPSSALKAMAGKLLAGGDVPDPHDPRERIKLAGERRDAEGERERSRERRPNRSPRLAKRTRRSPSVSKKKKSSSSRSRSKKASRKKSRSRDRRK